jgi:tyrosyl-tRNA synthetase
MSIADELMWEYYELVTDIPLAKIQEMKNLCEQGKQNPKDAKVKLALEIIKDLYGEKKAHEAHQNFQRVVVNKDLPEEIPEVKYTAQNLPLKLSTIMVENQLCSSNGEAKRLIQGKGVYLDGRRIDDPFLEINISMQGILKVGKRKFLKIEIGG